MPADPLIQAIILGIVQGLTEFLPISSSAHLLVIPWLMGWQPLGIIFDVVLHSGTLLAVLIFFRKEVFALIQQLSDQIRGITRPSLQPQLLWPIVLGTIPAVVVAGLFHDWIEERMRQPVVTVVTLSVFGVVLWWADRYSHRQRSLVDLQPIDGLWIGLAQTLALVPGVSRAGITITMALLLGFSRIDSARFSFLLAIPIIMLAALAGLYELVRDGAAGSQTATLFVAGVLFSFLSGFLCITYFLRFLENRSLLSFAVYRIGLAAVIFFWLVL